MKSIHTYTAKLCLLCTICMVSQQFVFSQTDLDAIMLKKNIFCVGGMVSSNTWTDYWEGTFKRDNENLGKVTTNMYAAMGNYGLTDKLNVLFSLPYVTTKSSAGTLAGTNGFQDLSLMLKWMPYQVRLGSKNRLSLLGVGKISLPVNNYVADFLPMSIGMRSKTAGVRILVDFQRSKFFATASGAYTYRANIDIDRNSYYTTEMHYTNEVEMPNVTGYNLRTGYRSKSWIAEAVLENMTTLGGFDIRKNDMPFPSNKMNMTQAGVNFKHTTKVVRGLEFTGGARYVISGRNVGQATTVYGGIFYLMDLAAKRKLRTNQSQQP